MEITRNTLVKDVDEYQNQKLDENANDIDDLSKSLENYLEKDNNRLFIGRGMTNDANIGHGTIGNSGWYVCGAGSKNVPDQYGTLIHFDRDTVSKAQIFIQISTGKMYSRSRSSSGVWSSWLITN